jgi:hypothetical protein
MEGNSKEDLMQYEVKNLISGITGWSGLSGPIPNGGDLRKKREQARLATLKAVNQGRDSRELRPVEPTKAEK